MNSDEKINEVKKAYANMILNVTKEAAARVMVSERKAARLEAEMKSSKDEAIFMLMRLKQMMDAKLSEAEMASQAQVKKINELEAQLHEAEDIVEELREEVNSVQRKLARALQKEEVKCMVQVDEGQKENLFSSPSSFIFPPPYKQENFFQDFDKDTSNIGQKLYKHLVPSLRSYYDDMELPAIISRSNRTKRYRNGCIQRILACEQKNLIHNDLATKVTESQNNPEKGPSPGNETRKIKTITSPNKKQKISSPNQNEKNSVADSSSLTSTRPDLQPLEHEKSKLPLGNEAGQVDPPEAKALEIDGVPMIKPLLRYQRKRKRGTAGSDGDDARNKITNSEDDKSSVLETGEVNSQQESAQEETDQEVVSVGMSAKEELPLEQIAQQRQRDRNEPRPYAENEEEEDANLEALAIQLMLECCRSMEVDILSGLCLLCSSILT